MHEIETSMTMKTGEVGPANEGKLIAVRGKIVGDIVDDQPWGWKIHLDDGSGKLLVFIAPATKIDVSELRTGQTLKVVGLSGRYHAIKCLIWFIPQLLRILDFGCPKIWSI